MKILQVFDYYNLEEVYNHLEKGKPFPRHHFWGYDILKDQGFEVSEVVNMENSFLHRLGKLLRYPTLYKQLIALKKLKHYDLIFCPFLNDNHLLVFLRFLRIIKTPILGIQHKTFKSKFDTNIWKRIYSRIRKHIYQKGCDRMLYFNKKIYDADEYKTEKTDYFKSWGIDMTFFENINKEEIPDKDYIYITGGTNRDFPIIEEVAQKVSAKFLISSKSKINYNFNSSIANLKIVEKYYYLGDFDFYYNILPYYRNARAFGIPLLNSIEKPTGITVIFEAFALKKPVISTVNEFYPIDLEEEGVGFYTHYHDGDSWIRPVNELNNSQEMAREMGERGYQLAKNKYNYELFGKQLVEEARRFSSEVQEPKKDNPTLSTK